MGSNSHSSMLRRRRKDDYRNEKRSLTTVKRKTCTNSLRVCDPRARKEEHCLGEVVPPEVRCRARRRPTPKLGGARQLTSTITQMHGPEPIDGVNIFRSGGHACTGCAGTPWKCSKTLPVSRAANGTPAIVSCTDPVRNAHLRVNSAFVQTSKLRSKSRRTTVDKVCYPACSAVTETQNKTAGSPLRL